MLPNMYRSCLNPRYADSYVLNATKIICGKFYHKVAHGDPKNFMNAFALYF